MTGMRELDRRTAEGIEVALLWDPQTDRVFVAVDEGEGFGFQIDVEPARALDAFHHPYAYANAFEGFAVAA